MQTIQILDYSEKSFVVFGNTKPIKDLLKSIGGKFNPFLKKDGQTFAGWIFSRNKKDEVEKIIAQPEPAVEPMESVKLLDVLTAYHKLSEQDKKELYATLNNEIPGKKPSNKKSGEKTLSTYDQFKKFVGFKIKCSLPITDDYVLLTSAGWLLRTNLESEIGFKVDYEPKQNVILPLHLVKAFARDEKIMEVKYNYETHRGVLITNKKSVNFAGCDPDEWPKSFDIENAHEFEIKEHVVNRMKVIVRFAGTDELRPVMTGVFADKNNIACTDAHKLGFETMKTGFKDEVIIPSSIVPMLMAGKAQVNNLHLKIQNENQMVRTRLIDGKYPNYMAVVPKENPIQITVDTAKTIENLKQLLAVANKTTKQVVFNLETGKMSAEDLDYSQSMELDIPIATKKGKSIVIGFNAEFLIEILRAADVEQATIEMSEPNRCAVIENRLLLMPVMLKD